MKTKISLDAFPSDTFDGTVETIRSTAIQTTTGGIAFPVLVKIDPKAKNLLLGMSGSVDIEVNAVPDALTVPIEAILDESGKKFVFVVEGTKVKKVEVTTGVAHRHARPDRQGPEGRATRSPRTSCRNSRTA